MRLLPGVATPGHEIYFKAAAVRNSSNLKADPGSLKQYQLLLGRRAHSAEDQSLGNASPGFLSCGSSSSNTLSCRASTAHEPALSDMPSTDYWTRLDEPLIWQGSETDAQTGSSTASLSPGFKVMLLSDGSVTRHLQLVTGQRIKAECLDMQALPASSSDLPQSAQVLKKPLVQRQVLLRPQRTTGVNGSTAETLGSRLVYAVSWWNASDAETYLAERERPIGVSLRGMELRREIASVFQGSSLQLERWFDAKGPFWGREYTLCTGGKPLTVIYEVFSPALQQLLDGRTSA